MHDNDRYTGGYTLFALLISLGGILAAFRDSLPTTGPLVLLAAVPLTWYILWVIGLNRAIIPKTVLRGKYAAYAIVIFLLCYSIPIFGIAIEWFIRDYFHLGHRIHNYLSPWVLVDALSTCALLMVIMFGMAIGRLFMLWRREQRQEQRAVRILDDNIDKFRRQIDSRQLLRMLDDVIETCRKTPELAFAKIQALSKQLRTRLYDSELRVKTSSFPVSSISTIESFLSRKRYAIIRHALLQLFIALISLTALFETPDQPDFTADGIMAFAGMYVIFNALIYGNMAITRLFIRNGQLIKYLVGGGIFLLVMCLIVTVMQIATYHSGVIGSDLPPVYSILSTLASMAAIALVLGGVSAFMALQQWLKGRRQLNKLDAQTKQLELSILQSQINPHFLFNVLNNVAMLVDESSDDAADMLVELRSLLDYQLSNVERLTTKVSDEFEFINCYLSLEKSRKSPFDFTIKTDGRIQDAEIPTLILIPFVENAAKHSTVVKGKRDIDIVINVDNNMFYFVCRNTYDVGKVTKRSDAGGLGIDNTLRRLQLIYDNKFNFSQTLTDNQFEVSLTIPLIK